MSAYKPSLIERETIILFNEAESEAEIYTYNKALISMLKKSPQMAKLKRKDETGAYTFIVDKKDLRIKLRRPASASHREKLIVSAEKARRNRSLQGNREE